MDKMDTGSSLTEVSRLKESNRDLLEQIENLKTNMKKKQDIIDELQEEINAHHSDIIGPGKNDDGNLNVQPYQTSASSYENINAALYGAVREPLREIERMLSILKDKKTVTKGEMSSLMRKMVDFRLSLENIDVGNGAVISIKTCINPRVWADHGTYLYNDDTMKNGATGKAVIADTMGFVYVNNLGEEIIDKAEVRVKE